MGLCTLGQSRDSSRGKTLKLGHPRPVLLGQQGGRCLEGSKGKSGEKRDRPPREGPKQVNPHKDLDFILSDAEALGRV